MIVSPTPIPQVTYFAVDVLVYERSLYVYILLFSQALLLWIQKPALFVFAVR